MSGIKTRSPKDNFWPHSSPARTLAFQAEKPGAAPGGVTILRNTMKIDVSKPLSHKEALILINELYPELEGYGRFEYYTQYSVYDVIVGKSLYFVFGNYFSTWKNLFVKRFRPAEDGKVYINQGSSYEDILIKTTRDYEIDVIKLREASKMYMIDLGKRHDIRFKVRNRK